jgi:uncharacterized protein
MPTNPAFDAIARSRFVSLTTFRKSGEPVSTAMWVGIDTDGALIISTHSDSWKVKRLQNDPRVELRPSSVRGAVKDGVVPVAGVAELIFDAVARDKYVPALRRKYGFQHRMLSWVERRRGDRAVDRVILRITPS